MFAHPILLEASKDTNFKYELVGRQLSTEKVGEINEISGCSKIKKRVAAVKDASCMLDFIKVQNKTFSNNLILIDSVLPQVMASMLLKFYTGCLSKTSDLLACIEEDNILDFDITNNHPYYAHKIKRLYFDLALGMIPKKVWCGDYNGKYRYLDKKSQLENFLITNTKFEVERSSSLHNFGEIYSEGSKLYMNLNLQIQFTKK